MNPVWITVLVLIVFIVVLRVRNRARQRRPERPEGYMRQISGHQVNVRLHPRMHSALLHVHGMQYGKGFRRKDPPELPQEAMADASFVPFTFTSSEVFGGALRTVAPVNSSIPDLDLLSARRLVEDLKRLESEPLPPSATEFAEGADLEAYPEALREEIEAFLKERYEYLAEVRSAGTDATAHEERDPDGMEAVKPQ